MAKAIIRNILDFLYEKYWEGSVLVPLTTICNISFFQDHLIYDLCLYIIMNEEPLHF